MVLGWNEVIVRIKRRNFVCELCLKLQARTTHLPILFSLDVLLLKEHGIHKSSWRFAVERHNPLEFIHSCQ